VTPRAIEYGLIAALLAERAVSLYFFAVVCFVIAGFTIAIDHAAGDRLA
jgi:hypothetical protein